MFTYSRRRLFAVNTKRYPDSVKRCLEYYGDTSLYPMDIFLGIDHLPFKATAKAALLIAKICITSPSYEAGTKNLYDAYDIKISKSEAWEITEYVGDIVLTNELQLVAADLQAYDVSKARIARPGRRPKDGFALYVMPDGSMYNTKPNTRNMSPATDEEDTQTIESEQPAKATSAHGRS